MAEEVVPPAPGTAPLELGPPKSATDNEIPLEEQEAVKKLMGEYTIARAFDRPAHIMVARDRRYASGMATADWAVSANLLGSYIDILVSFIYARNPKVSIRPSEQTGKAAMRERQLFAKTLQIVVQRLWKDANLKKSMKQAVRSGFSTSIGWFKAAFHLDTKRDPLIESELNDVQDNIERIRVAEESLFAPEGEGGLDPTMTREEKVAELQLLVQGLEAKVEVIVRKGLMIDFVPTEQLQVWVDVRNIDDYLEAGCISDEIFILKSEAKARFPELNDEDVRTATTYYQKAPQNYGAHDVAGPMAPMGIELAGQDTQGLATGSVASQYSTSQAYAGVNIDSSGKPTEYLKVIEAWDRRDNHVKTMIEGVKKWARKPFTPQFPTARFFPYFKVDFFPVDGERWPQSLSWRLSKLQDEYGSTRSNGRLTRQRSIPGTMFNAGQIEEQDMQKIQSSTQAEFVGVKPKDPDVDLNKLFAEKPLPTINIELFDTSQIIGDMEKISGVQEALQTSQTVQKTATQADIEQSGFAARTTSERDCVEETLSEFAVYTAQLALQALSYQDVMKIAGPLAFWPENLPLEAITQLLDIDIEAGSTGRPNTANERDAWIQILPVLERMLPLVIQFQGTPIGIAYLELMRETLARFDDRLDIERFLPGITGEAAVTDPLLGARDPATGQPLAAPGAMPMPQPGAPPFPPEEAAAPPGEPPAATAEVLPPAPQLTPPA